MKKVTLLGLIMVLSMQTAFALIPPAVTYCKLAGYKLEQGNCVFTKDANCPMWDFFYGKCGQKYSFCEQHGGKIENRNENMGTWMATYAVCKFKDSECLEIDFCRGSCKPGKFRHFSLAKDGM